MAKKPTIRDVARLADVSPATVSYVLNGIEKVSAETKTRVLAAIKELGYYPDFTAVSLSRRKSNLIGVIFPGLISRVGYSSHLTSGIESVARHNGFDVLVTGLLQSEDCINWIKKRNLDGVVFAWDLPNQQLIQMDELNIPVVLIDVYEGNTDKYFRVWIDDELGGYLATKHLIDLGHRNIAIVSNYPESSQVNRRRFLGYRRALTEAKIEFRDEWLFGCKEFDLDTGYELADQILQSKHNITAIFAVNDLLAIIVMKAMLSRQKQIPGDYSIVGIDGLEIGRLTTPGLTTVSQNVFMKGAAAAEALVRAIEAAEPTRKSFQIPIRLIVRESTGAVKSD